MFFDGVLKNGIKTILSPTPGTEAMTALVFVPVGSRYETEKVAGVSHFLEHMMFKGTKKRPTAKIIAKELDAIGASYNAYTSKEYTGYYIKADARHTDLALDLLSDVYFNSIFKADEIEREKGAVIQEINMNEDNPLRSIDDLFEERLFSGSTLGRNIAGSIKTVSELTRNDVVGWHNTFYRPENTIISMAGKIDSSTQHKIKKYFDVKRSYGRKVNFVSLRKPAHNAGEKIFLKQKETDQLQVMLGFQSLPYGHELEGALSLLQIILGGTMSSRLFTEVRERRGWAYLIRAGVSQYRDTGTFVVHAGLDSSKLNPALGVIMNELKKIKEKKVDKKELQDAKENWRGRMVLAWEDSSFESEWFATETAFYKKVETPDDVWKKISKVTPEMVGRAAKSIIKFNEMKVAIIGKPSEKVKL